MASSSLSSTTDGLLGSGAYGSVFKHYDNRTNSLVAVKRINLGPVHNVDVTKEVEDVHKEVALMKKFNHVRIVQYIRAEREANILSIYMELMSGGSVKEELDKNGAMSEVQAKRYTLQLLEGLSYLHGKDIIHRDIKGSNILCDGKGNIKLADFGVSKQIIRIQTLTDNTNANTNMKGSSYWMAPEVIQGTEYGIGADIWSTGATLVEMLTTHPPWHHLPPFPAMYNIGILKKEGYVLDSTISENAKRFLAETFTPEEQRPRADKLLQHSWLIDNSVEDDDEENRDVEIEVVSAGSGCVSLEQGLIIIPPPPTSMKLVRTVEVSRWCTSVCEYQGIIYVGLDNSAGVDRIDKNNKLTKSFLTLSGYVYAITVYKYAIYTLVGSKGSYSVDVHHLTGEPITSWYAHADSMYCNEFVFINNQVVVPHRKSQQLILYSLTGELVTYLPCLLLTDTVTAICAADSNSVIISNRDSSLVFKVDIVTGEVLWRCDQIKSPLGVTCYRSNYVLVASSGTTTTIWVLNRKTGKLLTTITDHTVRTMAGVFDLHISENTLIVPRCGEKTVLFYQLD